MRVQYGTIVYLASPYSDRDARIRHLRFVAACNVAAGLVNAGYVVFCPIAHSHPLEVYGGLPGGWDLWKKQDLPLLTLCDELHVACFPGWKLSKGLTAEIDNWQALFPEAPLVYHHFDELPLTAPVTFPKVTARG
jgi:hypothetical protein